MLPIFRRIFPVMIILVIISGEPSAQDRSFITGKITDSRTGDPLTGATVTLSESTGISADHMGVYRLAVIPGEHTLTFNFVGYKPERRTIRIGSSDTLYLDIPLVIQLKVLDEIVVTAGKFNQKLSDITVSMEIIKPVMIEENNHITLETLLDRMPGIDVLDGQTSIRGGSGYSYGAGSRVLVLVDDLPIITADVGDVKWDFMPVENVNQVEILKGASSVLYGSSALNGVVNLRTAFPKPDPETSINVHSGVYMDPKRSELIWWDKRPVYYGLNMNHLRKAGNIDIVVGGNFFHNPGYRENEYDTWGRGNLKLNMNSKNVAGLSYGVNSSFMYQDKSDFLLWSHANIGYRQNPASVSKLTGIRVNVDPYLFFQQNEQTKHSLKTRFFEVDNQFPDVPHNDNQSFFYFGEYQFLRKIAREIHWSVGTSANYSKVISNLYGDHNGSNIAVYTQLDTRFFQRLKWSAGVRWETATLDEERINALPVLRTGLNFQAANFTFIRGSVGQGYRFPSIAEKHTATTIGSLNIVPNPDLKSEKGWSAEIGLKQGLQFGGWHGFLDIAGFWTEYSDMIEFTFGIYEPIPPQTDTLGFKSLNVGNARINGIELNLALQGRIGPLEIDFLTGYTYMNPIDLNVEKGNTTSIKSTKYLKYRYKHSYKGDIQISWRNFSTGMNLKYASFMLEVDQVFVDPLYGALILPGYADYRKENERGSLVFDHRLSYEIRDKFKVSLITKNLFNKEYIGRPGDIGPPRTIILQLSLKF